MRVYGSPIASAADLRDELRAIPEVAARLATPGYQLGVVDCGPHFELVMICPAPLPGHTSRQLYKRVQVPRDWPPEMVRTIGVRIVQQLDEGLQVPA